MLWSTTSYAPGTKGIASRTLFASYQLNYLYRICAISALGSVCTAQTWDIISCLFCRCQRLWTDCRLVLWLFLISWPFGVFVQLILTASWLVRRYPYDWCATLQLCEWSTIPDVCKHYWPFRSLLFIWLCTALYEALFTGIRLLRDTVAFAPFSIL